MDQPRKSSLIEDSVEPLPRASEVSVASVVSNAERGSVSGRPSTAASVLSHLVGVDKQYECLCCSMSGNAVSLIASACLFATITVVQYIFSFIANSLALRADCISMGVDTLTFLGNLFAECAPFPDQKRRIELTMSGISHCLLLGFTISFIFEAWDNAHVSGDDEGDDVNGWIVLGFALGGLLFDGISLFVYHAFGDDEVHGLAADDVLAIEGEHADALTCGINTNMCAALLHVLSDLLRSTTTLVESIVLLKYKNINGTKADGVSALIVCSIIAVGAFAALLTWCREVCVYLHGQGSGGLQRSSHTDKSEKFVG